MKSPYNNPPDSGSGGSSLVSPTAENDVLMGGGSPLVWAKKTLAELKSALSLLLASSADINAGTDNAKFVTADALAGSNIGTQVVQMVIFDAAADVIAGDGKGYFVVPPELNGMNLVRVAATVLTAGTTNATTIQIHNVTDNQDMLSTLMNIESTESSTRTSGTPGTIDATHDDVVTGDLLRIDVDGVSTTAPKGLIVEMAFALP
jgi:hypothetical protein